MTTESKGSLDRAVQMVLKQLHSSINWLLSAIVLCFTFSYHTRLQTATILPIKAIARSSNDPEKLKAAFGYFKWRKQSDLQFARAAVRFQFSLYLPVLILSQSTLSAIAAVGVFSWQGADTAFWVAKVFWYWGLIFSFFSLISSTIDQMLAWIPGAGNTNVCHDDRLAVMPLLSVPSTIRPTGGSVFSAEEYEPSWWMAYVWQCPTMLMNWSWVMFFAGFILYILTPVIPGNSQEHELHVRSRIFCDQGGN